MLIQEAKAVARRWVLEEARTTPGFWGAFFHGSTTALPAAAPLPPTSDVDLIVVLADSQPLPKLGKIRYQGVLLDVSYLPRAELQSPAKVLSLSHLAGSFRTASVIADPSGELTRLQTVVEREFVQRRWVYARCAHAQSKILNNLQGLDEAAPFHDQVLPWLFGAGVTTHLLLVAGLRNPTVRQRYLAARQLLADYGHLDFYAPLLALLGGARMSRAQVEGHLAALPAVFDVAKAVIRSPFPFASDLSDEARPIAIDGSRALIERGYHREAIFWIAVTYSRCQQVLYQDAPPGVYAQFDPGYRHLLGDLGITSFADLQQRSAQIRAALPQVWAVAEAIMAANPALEADTGPDPTAGTRETAG